MKLRNRSISLALTLVVAFPAFAKTDGAATRNITTPKQQFGHDIGDDYQLVNYTQETEYLQKLAKESDRMKLVDIGLTAEGRHQYMAIISSPENIKNLEHYRDISQKLALAEGLTDDQAQALAEEGKAVVWIDGGLHATEIVGAQQLIETIYELNAKTDPETMRFLHDDIILCTYANPDGMELVSNWYMRNPDPKQRALDGVPRLWQKYIGHDNNRDFFMPTTSPRPPTSTASSAATGTRRSSTTTTRPAPLAPSSSCRPSATRSITSMTRWSSSALKPSALPCTSVSSKRQARLHLTQRRALLHMVQRRPPHHLLLPQQDRPLNRNHRQSHARAAAAAG